MSNLFDIPWYRVVTIMALTWLAAAGPMPAFSMPLAGRRALNMSAPDSAARTHTRNGTTHEFSN